MSNVQQGDRKEAWRQGNLSVDRVCIGHAYPKNGNFHNPTPRYSWEAKKDSKLVGTYHSLTAAKDLLLNYF